MNYNSTRNSGAEKTSKFAIANGISTEGGLFVPESIPSLSLKQLESMATSSYKSIAKTVLSLFLTDFTKEEIENCVNSASCEITGCFIRCTEEHCHFSGNSGNNTCKKDY